MRYFTVSRLVVAGGGRSLVQLDVVQFDLPYIRGRDLVSTLSVLILILNLYHGLVCVGVVVLLLVIDVTIVDIHHLSFFIFLLVYWGLGIIIIIRWLEVYLLLAF